MKRWPYRPDPLPDEALSSWLRRVAGVYGMSLEELLLEDLRLRRTKLDEIDAGFDEEDTLRLATRSGLSVDQLRSMTGFMGIQERLPEFLVHYLEDLRILLSIERTKSHLADCGRPWSRSPRWSKPAVCPICLGMDVEPYLRLSWRFPFISTCLDHGVYLVAVPQKVADLKVAPKSGAALPAPDALLELDQKTVAGLRDGSVGHLGRDIAIDQWLRLLRCLIQELRSYQYLNAWYDRGLVEGIWLRAGVKKPKRGAAPTVFERISHDRQMEQMAAVAVAVRALGNGQIVGRGKSAEQLQPENAPLLTMEFTRYRAALAMLLRELRDAADDDQRKEAIANAKRSTPLWRAFRDFILCMGDDDDAREAELLEAYL